MNGFACFLTLAAVVISTTDATTLRGGNKLKTIVDTTNEKLREVDWCTSKNFQNQQFAMDMDHVETGSTVSGNVTLTNGVITGICDLTLSKKATFDDETLVLCGSAKATAVIGSADYRIKVDSASEYAEARDVVGQASEMFQHLFIDICVQYSDSKTPKNIQSFDVRYQSGNDKLIYSDVVPSESYTDMFNFDLRASLRQIIVTAFEKNIKVKFNQAIQSLAAAATA